MKTAMVLIFIGLGFIAIAQQKVNEHFYYAKECRVDNGDESKNMGESFVYFTKDICVFKIGGIKQIKAFKVLNYIEANLDSDHYYFVCNPSNSSSFIFNISPNANGTGAVQIQFGNLYCAFTGSSDPKKLYNVKNILIKK